MVTVTSKNCLIDVTDLYGNYTITICILHMGIKPKMLSALFRIGQSSKDKACLLQLPLRSTGAHTL